jgi:thiol:disulfide interchange protein DsbC
MILRICKTLFILSGLCFSMISHADKPAAIELKDIPPADFQQRLKDKFPGADGAKIERAFPGFWAVSKDEEILFFNDDQTIMINGNVVDLVNKESITSKIMEKNKPKIDVSELPIKDAIKLTSGKHKVYVFSDPDCPYCKRLEASLNQLKDAEIYIFPLPLASLHPNSTAIAESIWCNKNQKKAWMAYMDANTTPKESKCDNPISRNLALAEKLRIHGTPAIIFADGSVIPGAIPLENITQKINSLAQK